MRRVIIECDRCGKSGFVRKARQELNYKDRLLDLCEICVGFIVHDIDQYRRLVDAKRVADRAQELGHG